MKLTFLCTSTGKSAVTLTLYQKGPLVDGVRRFEAAPTAKLEISGLVEKEAAKFIMGRLFTVDIDLDLSADIERASPPPPPVDGEPKFPVVTPPIVKPPFPAHPIVVPEPPIVTPLDEDDDLVLADESDGSTRASRAARRKK